VWERRNGEEKWKRGEEMREWSEKVLGEERAQGWGGEQGREEVFKW
jgi:hypothetical protein